MKLKKLLCSILTLLIVLPLSPKITFAIDVEKIDKNCCCNNYDAKEVTDYNSQNVFTNEINKDVDYTYNKENDGRIWVDKSVTTDNNFNFNCGNIDTGAFDVILSAIGQDFNLSTIEKQNIDVAFIVDTSSSMLNETSDTNKSLKAEVTVNSLNTALNYIMQDKNNRAGIVTFGGENVGDFKTLMSIDHYQADPKTKSFVELKDKKSIHRLVNDKNNKIDSVNFGGTTNFQKGIYGAYKLLKESSKTANGNIPIVIFLTDGVPIWYTVNYKDEGVMDSDVASDMLWQNASLKDSDGNNSAGAQSTTPLASYYSILTAQHYKDKISKLYNKNTYFSTIGMLDKATVEKKTELYINTLLNPSKSNLLKCKDNTSELFFEHVDDKAPINPGTFVSCPLLTPQRLYQCLNAKREHNSPYAQFDVLIKHNGKKVVIPSGAYKITKNPYLESGFNYADGAYTGQLTEDELSEIFYKIIVFNTRENPIDKEKNKITFSDTLEKNIQCYSDKMIIRYNGKNYNAVKKDSYIDGENTVTEYVCNETVTDYNDKIINLSECSIKLICNNKTNIQTINWEFGSDILPIYTESKNKQKTSPIRLIYHIKLSDNVTSTNQLTHLSANAKFFPARNNPYYFSNARSAPPFYNDIQKDKVSPITGEPSNPSGAPASYIHKASLNDSMILDELGNNARISLVGQSIEITKNWADNNNMNVRPKNITVNLLDGENIIDTVSLTEADNWSHRWDNLPTNNNGVEIAYFITEEPIDGYDTSINDNIITNTYKNDNISIAGTKIWDDDNNKYNARPTSTTVYLLANDNIIDTKIIDSNTGWNYSWSNLKEYDENNNKIIYKIKEKDVPLYSTTYDGYNIINKYNNPKNNDPKPGEPKHNKPICNNPICKNISHIIFPKTGDNCNICPFIVLLIASSLTLVIVNLKLKKQS